MNKRGFDGPERRPTMPVGREPHWRPGGTWAPKSFAATVYGNDGTNGGWRSLR